MTRIEAVLKRERTIAAAGLGAIAVLAWIYVWRGAGMGMSALDMTTVSLFPHLQPDLGGSMAAGWLVVIAMWWIMMIAMMTPGAAPLVLLYGLVLRRHARNTREAYASMLILLAGYLVVWMVFAMIAAALQQALQRSGLVSEMMLWSRSAVLSAIVLAGAAMYQLSPLKRMCLAQCRHPVRFLTEHWRPGPVGSFVLGVRHGAFCVGCCWTLMALLFVGGVMNLVWIAALTVFVLVEKLAPATQGVRVGSAAILLAWAIATLLV